MKELERLRMVAPAKMPKAAIGAKAYKCISAFITRSAAAAKINNTARTNEWLLFFMKYKIFILLGKQK
jgi:hypothetical protein